MKQRILDIKLTAKLAVTIGVIFAFTFAITVLALSGTKGLADQFDTLREVSVAEIQHLHSFEQNVSAIRTDTLQIAGYDSENSAAILKRVSEHMSNADRSIDKVGAIISTEGQRKAFEATVASWTKYKEAWERCQAKVRTLDSEKAFLLVEKETEPIYSQNLIPAVSNLNESINKQIVTSNTAADQLASRTEQMILLTGIMALALSISSTMFLSKIIVGPVNEVQNRIERIGRHCIAELKAALERFEHGDLTCEVVPSTTPVPVRSKDELGQLGLAFNVVLDSLQSTISSYNRSRLGLATMVSAIRTNSETLLDSSGTLKSISTEAGHASRQIAEGSEQLATNATEAASIMEETLAQIDSVKRSSVEQVGAVKSASESLVLAESGVTEVAAAAQQMFAAASEGNRSVKETLKAMEKVQERVVDTSSKVQDLDAKGNEIGKIVLTIQGIAEQTNLLALNAAIEAARAGEHGRGFAVVADEVRKLAEGASSASKEIEHLIVGITNTVGETVLAIQATGADVTHGTELSLQAGDALEEILRASEQVAKQSESVAKIAMDAASSMNRVASVAEENLQAANEMVVGARRVSDAISNVASVSEESAAGAEQLSASIEEAGKSASDVTSVSQELSDVVSRFRVENETSATFLRVAA